MRGHLDREVAADDMAAGSRVSGSEIRPERHPLGIHAADRAVAGARDHVLTDEARPGGRIAGHEGSSLAPLTVPRERVAAGRILDEHQRPLAGARITPLVVDELTGATMRLDARAVTADEAGTFRLRRLPSRPGGGARR